MTDPLLQTSRGQTPLTPDDLVGLKPTWVRTHGDLNEAEQANLIQGLQTLRTPKLEQVLDDLYLRRLHRRLFGEVWSWAGSYRQRVTNLGVEPHQIPVSVRNVCEDARAWAENDDPTTVAARFHHALVAVHPFVNGNGRHARVAADLLVRALGEPALRWGRGYPTVGEARAAYLAALRAADAGDEQPLLTFVRT